MLLRRPDSLAAAVLLAAMVPFREPPPADLAGKRVAVVNGRRDPIATAEHTETLTAQLRDRGADVTVLPHDGGHAIDPALLPAIAAFVGDGHVRKRPSDVG